MKTAVRITAIGINEVLLSAMSASDDVKILSVSCIAPKLKMENTIARPVYFFTMKLGLKVCYMKIKELLQSPCILRQMEPKSILRQMGKILRQTVGG